MLSAALAASKRSVCLIDIDPQYPKVDESARRDLAEARRELEAEAPKGAAPDPFLEQLEKERAKGNHDAAVPEPAANGSGGEQPDPV